VDLAQPEWRVRVQATDPRRQRELTAVLDGVRRAFRSADISESDEGAFIYVTDHATAITVEQHLAQVLANATFTLSVQITHWSASGSAWVQAPDREPNLTLGTALDSSSIRAAVMLSTTFEVPGYEIVAFHGEVFGLVVRSRNLLTNLGARSQAIMGGELHGLTKLLSDSRNDALNRLRTNALNQGANAVVGLRYDTSEIGETANEVVAYGTAVTVRSLARRDIP
jgi:uncharacterized protein YbjQ (UPF0145 family)